MTEKLIAIVALLAGLAAMLGTTVAQQTQPLPPSPFTTLTHTYLERALAGDSATVAALSLDDEATLHTLGFARARSVELERVLRTLRVSGSGLAGPDTVVVTYASKVDWCAGFAGTTELQLQFVRRGPAWKVHYAGVGAC